MELRRLNLVLVTLAFILTALPSAVLADPNDPNDPANWDDAKLIARTMREYQGRYLYVKGCAPSEITWRKGPCCQGGGGVDAPNFPPDNFYRYCTDPNFDCDPNTVKFVNNIIHNFWYSFESTETRIYNQFIHMEDNEPNNFWDPNWTPSVIEDYNSTTTEEVLNECYEGDGNVPTYWVGEVNSTNYRDTLEAYYEVVAEKFRVCSSGEFGFFQELPPRPNDVNYASGFGNEPNCDAAKAEANDNWSSWGSPSGDYGAWENTVAGDSSYFAWKGAQRFRIEDDLTGHTGTAKLFLHIDDANDEPGSSQWSNMDGLKQTENWQYFCNATVGGFWQTGHYFANFKPYFVGNCPPTPGVPTGWELEDAKVLIWPDFNTDPNGWVEDPPPDVYIYKHDEKPLVYAANADCCPVASEGETVDGNVVYPWPADSVAVELNEPYSTEAATLYINGWNGTGDALTDPNKVLCYSNVYSIPFSVRAKQMAGDANSVWIKFKVTFWDTGGSTIYRAEKDITFEVKPTEGDRCCREDDCTVCSGKAGKTFESASCGAGPVRHPQLWVLDNNDIEFAPPDYNDESFIVYTPECSFMSGYNAVLYGSDVNVTDTTAGVIYVFEYDSDCTFPCKSSCRLKMKTDLDGKKLVEYEYDGEDRLEKQKDGDYPTSYYIEYDYNDTTGYLDTITAEANDANRTCTLEYDSNGMVIGASTGSGGCESCGGGDFKYSFGSDGRIRQVLTYDTEEVVYEYGYDETGRRTEKWLGAKTDANCVQEKFYTKDGSGSIVDINDYIDPASYRATREYRNSAGLVTKRIRCDDPNEDPADPTDPNRCYVENIFYTYDANNLMTKKVVLPPVPLSDTNEPDPDSGRRKEYVYDPNYNGRLITETCFGADEVNFVVISNTYEYTQDGKNVRITSSTDARDANTVYSYTVDSNDVVPKYKTMPKVTTGISGTKQLKYEYEYDGQNRVTIEKLLDHQDGDKVLVQTKYEYDVFSNLKYRYDDYNEPNEEITEYKYNGFNEMTRMILPSGVVSGRSYYDNGKLESEFVLANPDDVNLTEPNLLSQTKYSYNGNGRLEKIERAVDTNEFDYNEPNSNSWVRTDYEYDVQGNRTKVIEDVNGLGLETTYEYNHQGEVIKVTLPNGKWTETVRDGRGMVAQTIVGYGSTPKATTTFLYDKNGNLQWQKSPDSIWTKYEYDDFDRVKKITRGL